MGSCPTCIAMPLSDYEASPGVQVELCVHCRGLFLDRDEIRQLVGRGSLGDATEVVPLSLGDDIAMLCPKCVNIAMQPLRLRGSESESVWQCRTCGGLWLAEGAFFELARALWGRESGIGDRGSRIGDRGSGIEDRGSRIGTGTRAGLQYSRSRFDVGLENLIGVPLMLLLSWLFCSTMLGSLLASMVSMPFHELGHAAASWLSSRVAIPLPFFTVWYDDQSILMGLIVTGALGWLAFHSYREKNRFGLATAGVLLVVQAVLTLIVPASRTLMWQILSGALGELLFGAFLLVAFHFPFPDRIRWDFWRWVAIIPGALCFTYAIRLWRTASNDVTQMPWGSALGSESDGDMNRLVNHFGWNANELAEFYLRTGYLCVTAIVVAYGYALWRHQRKNGTFPVLERLIRR